MKRRHRMPFGAECRDDGSVRFRLWAPAAQQVESRLRDGERVQADLPLTRAIKAGSNLSRCGQIWISLPISN